MKNTYLAMYSIFAILNFSTIKTKTINTHVQLMITAG